MALTATVHGEEVRIYADGELIGTVAHEVEYGGGHKLVGRGVAVRGDGILDRTYRAGFAATAVETFRKDDERLTATPTDALAFHVTVTPAGNDDDDVDGIAEDLTFLLHDATAGGIGDPFRALGGCATVVTPL